MEQQLELGASEEGPWTKKILGFFPPYIAQESGVISSCCVSECLEKASEVRVREWAVLNTRSYFHTHVPYIKVLMLEESNPSIQNFPITCRHFMSHLAL